MTFLYRRDAWCGDQPVQCFHYTIRGANLLTLSFIYPLDKKQSLALGVEANQQLRLHKTMVS